MDGIHWQLAVLSKAIHYKNLSGAAANVGISQPQLSRIISRIEQELGVVLLDRTARRKSGWTPVAYKIAETYFKTSRKLTQSLQMLTTGDEIAHLSIGALEGLVPLANDFSRQIFASTKIQTIELSVLDLSELEERFDREEFDLVFTCREPGKHKYSNVREIGFQVLERQGSGVGAKVFSPFEYANHLHATTRRSSEEKASSGRGTRAKKAAHAKDEKVPSLISNSLAVRKYWIEEAGGAGVVPSDVRRKKASDNDVPVIMIATDVINPSLWRKFCDIRL